MKRRLTLRTEHLATLTADEITEIAAGREVTTPEGTLCVTWWATICDFNRCVVAR